MNQAFFSLTSCALAKPSHANDPAAVVPHQDQVDCTPRGHLAMSGDMLVVTLGVRVLIASSGERPGKLLNILQ